MVPRAVAVSPADAVALVHASRRRRRMLAGVFGALVVPHVVLVFAAPMLLLSLSITATPAMIFGLAGDGERRALRLLALPEAQATVERTTLVVSAGERVVYAPVAASLAQRLRARLARPLPPARLVRDARARDDDAPRS